MTHPATARRATPGRTIGRTTGVPSLQVLRTTAAASACLGLLLLALSWLAPAGNPESAPYATGKAPSMRFDYHADARPSPAYDNERVSAPAPVFRSVAEEVTVRYEYQGGPGTVSVAAELSTASGWRSLVELQPTTTFDTAGHGGAVRLDLARLEGRATAAADAIGIPATQVDLAVIPTVVAEDGSEFAPRLSLTLEPMRLSLVGGQDALQVEDTSPARQPVGASDTVVLAGHQVSTTDLRTAGLLLSLLALLLLGMALAGTRSRSGDEGALIRRRYASLLLPVAPLSAPSGRPVVDVTDFPTLARLAERYDLMVMHWTRSDVDTFVVHDDGVTYRYRTGAGHGEADDGLEADGAQARHTRGSIT